MTTDKTTALIEAFRAEIAAIPMGEECVQKGASAYNWGKHYLARLEALAAFEQPNLVKKQYENIGTVKIPNRKDMGLDEQPELAQDRFNTGSELNISPVREITVQEVALLFELEGRRAVYLTPYEAAKALAKLGTIRVVEG